MSTNITRWEPFREMEDMLRMYSPLFGRSTARGARELSAWRPTADITETDKEYLIKLNLPEVKKEDVHIMVDGNTITVSGERKQEREEDSGNEIRVESFYGTFSRSFVLPDNVNTNNIAAEAKEGVLRIHVPKKDSQQKPLSVEVK